MFVSVLRGLVIDSSFALPLPGACKVGPHWGSVRRVDPDYAAMKNKDVLAALQDVRSSDKRPCHACSIGHFRIITHSVRQRELARTRAVISCRPRVLSCIAKVTLSLHGSGSCTQWQRTVTGEWLAISSNYAVNDMPPEAKFAASDSGT